MRRKRSSLIVLAALATGSAVSGAAAAEPPATTVASTPSPPTTVAAAAETPATTVASTPSPPTTVAAAAETPATTVASTPSPPTTLVTIAEGTSTPAPEGSRDVSGTIEGIDGNAVNAQISLVLRDRQDRPIHMSGRVHGNRGLYERVISMNPDAPVDGRPAGGDRTWRIDDFPANADHFTLEVYPREPLAPFPRPNFTHYGGAVKRNIRLLPGRSISNLRIVFPLNCANVPGGTTGSIRLRHYVNGRPAGHIDRALASGAAFPPFGIQGFSARGDFAVNETAPQLDSLAPDRRYGVEVVVVNGARRTRYTFFDVPVRECERTDVFLWAGRSPVPPRYSRLAIAVPGPGFPVPGDFDGDGDDDVYFAVPNGGALWMSDGSGARFVKTSEPSNGTHRVVAGDFDGDGIDDLFFYGGGNRPDKLWDFDATGAHQVVAATAGMGGSRTYPLVGDFDVNRRDDLVFVSPSGPDTMRRFTAAGYTDSVLNLPAGFTVRAGDFDGDWQADLFLYRSLRDFGEFEAWQTKANGTSFTRHTYRLQPAQFQMVVGDISGDFRSDIVFYQPGGAIDVLWRGQGQTAPLFVRETTDLRITGSYLPVAGDWNGDGTDDLLMYGPGGAPDKVWRSNGPAWRPQIVHAG
jgi:hypothetical protein